MWHELQKPGCPVTTIAPAAKKDTITARSNIFTGHFICLKTSHPNTNIALIYFTVPRHNLTINQLQVLLKSFFTKLVSLTTRQYARWIRSASWLSSRPTALSPTTARQALYCDLPPYVGPSVMRVFHFIHRSKKHLCGWTV